MLGPPEPQVADTTTRDQAKTNHFSVAGMYSFFLYAVVVTAYVFMLNQQKVIQKALQSNARTASITDEDVEDVPAGFFFVLFLSLIVE